MTTIRIAIVLSLGLASSAATVYAAGESSEPTPEYLDASFSEQDAARVAAGFSSDAAAAASGDLLGALTAAADLVFLGTVVSQTYQYDQRGTPSTHTTFAISRLLKGDHTAQEFTLVQPGGPAQSGDRVMMVSDARHFNPGEQDILFVGVDPQNPVESLQARVLNRFRVYQDQVYDDDGYGVKVVPLGGGAYRLTLSEVRSMAERFRRIHVGPHWLEKQFTDQHRATPDSGGGSPEGVSAPAPGSMPAPASQDQPPAVDVHTFTALVAAAGG